MEKIYEIPIKSKIDMYQAWILSINWTLYKNQLTTSEIAILSYILYYNEKYKSIKEDDVRYELLFSTSVKKKIREEFSIDSQKFETYLNKLRKKGIITSSNGINPRFIVYIDNSLTVSFNFKLVSVKPTVIEEPPQLHIAPEPQAQKEELQQFEEPTEEFEDQEIQPDFSEIQSEEPSVGAGSIWDRYMGDERLNEVKKNGWSL